jgi:hypothetical protein
MYDKLSSEERSKLPSFIIGGGMKCGTTTLHWILNQHKNVFIPGSAEEEPHFFSIDDIEQNPDFFLKSQRGWDCLDFDKNLGKYLKWYLTFFESAQENQLIGEDCVSYLSSKKAPERIASLLPDVKLIFMLRDPVERTYSQYWHWVKTNRAIYDFENTLQFSPGHLIQRSFYREHIKNYLGYFERKQIKFIMFESFVNDMQNTIDEVCRFLGLDGNLDIGLLNTHVNKASVPRSITAQLLFNKVIKTKYSGRKYQCYHLPNASPDNYRVFPPLMLRMFQKVNLTQEKRYPPMKTETRKFLQCLFEKENRGLSDLIEIPVEKFWTYMSN